MNFNNYKAVFFDLDGTLIDSAKDLSIAIDSMAIEIGIPAPSIDQVKSWIGNGTAKLVERTLEHASGNKPNEDELKQALNLFSQAYSESVGEHSSLFPYTKELLVSLLAKNIKLACITNKPYGFTDFLLQQNFIRQFFSIVCAGDNVKHKKPDPWPLLYSANKFKIEIDECLMIGDSDNDIQAARNAGCDVLAVSYGYNKNIDIRQSKPDIIIDSFSEIL